MKKSSTRTVLFSLLLAASIGSYIYLNSVSSPVPEEASTVEEYEEGLEPNEVEIVLPDIQFVKKVIETGKRLIPAS